MKKNLRGKGCVLAGAYFGKKVNGEPFNFAVDGKLRQTSLVFRGAAEIEPLREEKENASNQK